MGRRLKGGNYGNGSDGGPLRKIVGICWVGGVRMECYECGHIAMPKSDIIGETNASRRRCHRCKSGKPAHFTGTPPTTMSNAEYDERSKTGEYKPLSEADWQRIFKLRCQSKQYGNITQEEIEFCHRGYLEDRERYEQMSKEVFEATKPFGA